MIEKFHPQLDIQFLIKCLFTLIMAFVVIITIVVEKNITCSFTNTVPLPNVIYYIGALFFLYTIIRIQKKYFNNISIFSFYICILTFSLFVFFIQTIIALWFPQQFGSDFAMVREQAYKFANEMSFSGDYSYFQRFPHQIAFTFFLSLLLKIGFSWTFIIIINALIVNLSCVLVSLSVYNITNNKIVPLFILFIGHFLLSLTWRSFIPYTDSWGMFFMTVSIFIYTVKTRYLVLKNILLLSSLFIGALIKTTVLIPLFAILFCFFIQSHSTRTKVLLSLFVVGVFCTLSIGKYIIEEKLNFHHNPNVELGLPYFFLLGQETSTYGTNGRGTTAAGIALSASSEKRVQTCLKHGLKRIILRGVIGNIKFYLIKIDIAFMDGEFDNVQRNIDFNEYSIKKHAMLSDVYYIGGKYYPLNASFAQLLWNLLLVVCLLSSFNMRKFAFEKQILFVSLIGITFYILIFEDRSKYIYMFVPLYLILSGLCLSSCKIDKTQIIGTYKRVLCEKLHCKLLI